MQIKMDFFEKNMMLFVIANDREDITQFNIRNFYAHSTRRRTIPSHNISSCSINKALSEAR